MVEGFDRRTFIKGAASVGAAGLAGALGLGVLQPTSDVDAQIVPISYPGLKVIDGSPAPYGLPLIPLEITAGGELRGVPDAGRDQLMWYKYCGHEQAPGTDPGFDSTNRLTYFVAEAQPTDEDAAWYADRLGETINVADVPDSTPTGPFQGYPGVGAPFRWRSEGVEPSGIITGILIKAKADRFSIEGVTQPPAEELLEAWMPRDPDDPEMRYVACCSFCTHFCCVPGFQETEIAIDQGAGAKILCTCHFSKYEPFTVAQYNRNIFVLPKPEEGAPSDVAHGSP